MFDSVCTLSCNDGVWEDHIFRCRVEGWVGLTSLAFTNT